MSISTYVGRDIVLYPPVCLVYATHQYGARNMNMFRRCTRCQLQDVSEEILYNRKHVAWHITVCTEFQISVDRYPMAVREIFCELMYVRKSDISFGYIQNIRIRVNKLDYRESPVSAMRNAISVVCLAFLNSGSREVDVTKGNRTI